MAMNTRIRDKIMILTSPESNSAQYDCARRIEKVWIGIAENSARYGHSSTHVSEIANSVTIDYIDNFCDPYLN